MEFKFVVREVNVVACGSPLLSKDRKVTLSLVGAINAGRTVVLESPVYDPLETEALPEVGDRMTMTLRLDGEDGD